MFCDTSTSCFGKTNPNMYIENTVWSTKWRGVVSFTPQNMNVPFISVFSGSLDAHKLNVYIHARIEVWYKTANCLAKHWNMADETKMEEREGAIRGASCSKENIMVDLATQVCCSCCSWSQLVLVGQGSVETSRTERCAPSAGPWRPTRPSFPPLEQLQSNDGKKISTRHHGM